MAHLLFLSHGTKVESGGQGLASLFVPRSVASFREFLVPSMDGGCTNRGDIGVSDAFRFLEDETFPEDSFCHKSTKHMHAGSKDVFLMHSYSSGSIYDTIVEIDANLPPLSAIQSALCADTTYNTRSLPDKYRRATDLLVNSVVGGAYCLGHSFAYNRVVVHGVGMSLGEILHAVVRKEGFGVDHMLMTHYPRVDMDMSVVEFLGALKKEYEDSNSDNVEFYENGGSLVKMSWPVLLGQWLPILKGMRAIVNMVWPVFAGWW